MSVSREEIIRMKKEDLKKQSVSIYVGLLQGLGVIIYTWLKIDTMIDRIDWFYALIFGLASLSGTFIFTQIWGLISIMNKTDPSAGDGKPERGSRVEGRDTRREPARRREPAQTDYRKEDNRRKRERANMSPTPYDEEDIPPPDDVDDRTRRRNERFDKRDRHNREDDLLE